MRAILAYDKLRMGWYSGEEILYLDSASFMKIKLFDGMKRIEGSLLDSGFKKLIKIALKKNEFFLLDYHNFSSYDKSIGNYDEGPIKGVAVWHIKEIPDWPDTFA